LFKIYFQQRVHVQFFFSLINSSHNFQPWSLNFSSCTPPHYKRFQIASQSLLSLTHFFINFKQIENWQKILNISLMWGVLLLYMNRGSVKFQWSGFKTVRAILLKEKKHIKLVKISHLLVNAGNELNSEHLEIFTIYIFHLILTSLMRFFSLSRIALTVLNPDHWNFTEPLFIYNNNTPHISISNIIYSKNNLIYLLSI
jgi:hypothetical protein